MMNLTTYVLKILFFDIFRPLQYLWYIFYLFDNTIMFIIALQ